MNLLLGYLMQVTIDFDGSVNNREDVEEMAFRSVNDFVVFLNDVILPCEIIMYLLWCVIFWRGTRYHILFSTGTMAVLMSFGLVDLGLHTYIVWHGAKYFTCFDTALNYVLICNLVN